LTAEQAGVLSYAMSRPLPSQWPAREALTHERFSDEPGSLLAPSGLVDIFECVPYGVTVAMLQFVDWA
jgi:hypothetical protein